MFLTLPSVQVHCEAMARPEKSRRTGRPPLPPGERKREPIKVLVTEEQRALLQAAADRAGMTISGYLRAAGLKQARIDTDETK